MGTGCVPNQRGHSGQDSAIATGQDSAIAPGEDSFIATGQDSAIAPGEDSFIATGQYCLNLVGLVVGLSNSVVGKRMK